MLGRMKPNPVLLIAMAVLGAAALTVAVAAGLGLLETETTTPGLAGAALLAAAGALRIAGRRR
jgi:hypothetical protein